MINLHTGRFHVLTEETEIVRKQTAGSMRRMEMRVCVYVCGKGGGRGSMACARPSSSEPRHGNGPSVVVGYACFTVYAPASPLPGLQRQ